MIKIITAIDNPKINEELKNEKNIEVIGKDIFYKEGILEILEKNININYIIINNKLSGEIKLNNLIEKIIEKNEKIKIIILIKKENKNNLNKIIKENNYIKNNNLKNIKNKSNKNSNSEKNDIEVIKDLKNKNIIRIFYTGEINLEKLKNYNNNDKQIYNNENIKTNKDKFTNKCKIDIKEKRVLILGERQVGKSTVISKIAEEIQCKKQKILIMETPKDGLDLLVIFSKRQKLVHKKIKIRNKYKIINEKRFIQKNKIETIKKLIIKINKNIDIIPYNKLINFKIIEKLEKKYNYIFIEINLEKNNVKNKKILKNFNEKILIIKPDLLGIKNAKKIIEKNKINNYKIILNNYNKNSIDEKIIENIFNKNKIIKKINNN